MFVYFLYIIAPPNMSKEEELEFAQENDDEEIERSDSDISTGEERKDDFSLLQTNPNNYIIPKSIVTDMKAIVNKHLMYIKYIIVIHIIIYLNYLIMLIKIMIKN